MKRGFEITSACKSQCLVKAKEAQDRAGSATDPHSHAAWDNVATIWRYIAAQSRDALPVNT